jgi:hypothetical protein
MKPVSGDCRPRLLRLRAVGALSLLAALLTGVTGAAAGEASARRVIGFSPDGAQFAMEEYGASDPGSGKGEIHSFISIVDTATNEILDDSVNATMDAGGSDLLAELRKLSAQGAAETLAFHKIGAQGRLIGADPSSRPGEMFSYAKVWPVEKAAKDVLDIAAPARRSWRSTMTSRSAPTLANHRANNRRASYSRWSSRTASASPSPRPSPILAPQTAAPSINTRSPKSGCCRAKGRRR